LVRGAGELASGVALRLWAAGFNVILTEIKFPLCVRRAVSFCEAVYHGSAEVEGAQGVLIDYPNEAEWLWASHRLPVMVDPELTHLEGVQPDVVVDAILAKKNLGLHREMADLVIALGPGFEAGVDAHVVVETNRGHNLGRLIFEGQAEPDTGSPGVIGGETVKRVLRAPADGLFMSDMDIGDPVAAGDVVGEVAGREVKAEISGILRGLIRPRTPVTAGLKIGDVDPRNRPEYCYTVSDKARALGGSVLEAVMIRYNRP
jgi:xanthine dehydrogenase accessory factor